MRPQFLATFVLMLVTSVRHEVFAVALDVVSASSGTYSIAISTEEVFDTLVISVDGNVTEGTNLIPYSNAFGAKVLTSNTEGFRLLAPLGAPESDGVYEPGLTHAIDMTYGVTVPLPGAWIDGLSGEPFLEVNLVSGIATASVQLLYQGNTIGSHSTSIPAASLTGDYNGDGFVNLTDYSVWRDNLGAAFFLANETESLGVVDVEDYLAWKSNFGATLNELGISNNTLPEPSALALIFLISLAGCVLFNNVVSKDLPVTSGRHCVASQRSRPKDCYKSWLFRHPRTA